MESQLLQENLKAALNYLGQPGVTFVYLEAKGNALMLTTMTSVMTLHTSIGAKNVTEGNCSVPFPILKELVDSLRPEVIVLTLDKDLKLTLRQGKEKSTLQADVDFKPVIPSISEYDFSMSGDTLNTIGRYVSIAAGVNDAREMMNGVNWVVDEALEIVEAAASDGYRLAVYRAAMERKPGRPKNPYQCLVPANSMSHISGRFATSEHVNIKITEKAVLFDDGVRFAAAQRIASEYFNYSQVIPTRFTGEFVVPGDELSKAIGTIKPFATQSDNQCKLVVRPATETVPASVLVRGYGDNGDAERGVNRLAFVSGERYEVIVNHSFMNALAKAVGSQPLLVKFSGVNQPLVAGINNSDVYQHVIMPMRKQL